MSAARSEALHSGSTFHALIATAGRQRLDRLLGIGDLCQLSRRATAELSRVAVDLQH